MHLQVAFQLLRKFAVALLSAEKTGQPRTPRTPSPHHRSPVRATRNPSCSYGITIAPCHIPYGKAIQETQSSSILFPSFSRSCPPAPFCLLLHRSSTLSA